MQAPFVITAGSALTPYGIGTNAYAQGSTPTSKPLEGNYATHTEVAMVPDYDAQQLLAVRSVSNFDRLTLHVCVAVDQLHKQLGYADLTARRQALADDRMCIVIGSAGPLQSIVDFDLQTIEEPSYVQPSRVPNVVFNVPASYAAIRHGIRGSCITLTDGDSSSLKAFAIAAGQLQFGRIDLAMVGGAEEATPAYAMYRQAMDQSSSSNGLPISEGASLFAMETVEHARQAGHSSLAGLFGCAQVFSPNAPQVGLRACLAKLERQFPQAMAAISIVYCDADVEASELGLSEVTQVQLDQKLGRTGAMYGSLALLDALTSNQVADHSVILVLQADEAGACVAALFEKHGQLN